MSNYDVEGAIKLYQEALPDIVMMMAKLSTDCDALLSRVDAPRRSQSAPRLGDRPSSDAGTHDNSMAYGGCAAVIPGVITESRSRAASRVSE